VWLYRSNSLLWKTLHRTNLRQSFETTWVDSGNAPGLYLADAWIEPQLGHVILTEIFRGLPQPLQLKASIALLLGQDCVLPDPFKFIIH
jgi:hypothetical protein